MASWTDLCRANITLASFSRWQRGHRGLTALPSPLTAEGTNPSPAQLQFCEWSRRQARKLAESQSPRPLKLAPDHKAGSGVHLKKKILVPDIGGSNVKLMISREERREFPSGAKLGRRDFVARFEETLDREPVLDRIRESRIHWLMAQNYRSGRPCTSGAWTDGQFAARIAPSIATRAKPRGSARPCFPFRKGALRDLQFQRRLTLGQIIPLAPQA